jgi:hypothetical protein
MWRLFALSLLIVLGTAGYAEAAPPPPPTISSPVNYTVKGQARAGTLVTVSTSGGSTCSAVANASGAYTCQLLDSKEKPLAIGEEVIANAKDTATGEFSANTVSAIENLDGKEKAGFLRDGLFGCSGGNYGMSVGTLQAIGGVYVPVNDAAVTLNTGYLVYKECVLDGVIVRMREAATAGIIRNVIGQATQGPDGRPQFVSNQEAEQRIAADKLITEMTKDTYTKSICSPYREKIKARMVRTYFAASRNVNAGLACSTGMTPTQMESFRSGDFTTGGFEGLLDVALDPNNSELGASILSEIRMASNLEKLAQENLNDWEYGNGFRSMYQDEELPTETGDSRVVRKVVTPGYIISQIVSQAVGSGFRQLENANEIDQIVNSLFSNLTSTIMSNTSGLTGLTQSIGGRPPYLDQLSTEASAGVRNAAANAALGVLSSTIAAEEAYNSTKKSSRNLLLQAQTQLQAAENRCWELIIPKVQAAASACSTNENGSSSCLNIQLNISTSTQLVKSGTIALLAATGTQITQGSSYTFTVPTNTVINNGSLNLTNGENRSFANSTTLSVSVAETAAPGAGGTLVASLASSSPFTGGSLSLALQSGQKLPIGEVKFALNAIAPFTQVAASLIVGVAQQFSDSVFVNKVKVLLAQIEDDIKVSDAALLLLADLVRDIQNTASVSVQGDAVRRIDALIGERRLHTAYDVKMADQQRAVIEGQMKTLVEDTIKEWGTGSGWCNAENPEVITMWLNRWKVQ